ncbi:uncharacterized protein ISCGN_019794 [Ixodes scapularis]
MLSGFLAVCEDETAQNPTWRSPSAGVLSVLCPRPDLFGRGLALPLLPTTVPSLPLPRKEFTVRACHATCNCKELPTPSKTVLKATWQMTLLPRRQGPAMGAIKDEGESFGYEGTESEDFSEDRSGGLQRETQQRREVQGKTEWQGNRNHIDLGDTDNKPPSPESELDRRQVKSRPQQKRPRGQQQRANFPARHCGKSATERAVLTGYMPFLLLLLYQSLWTSCCPVTKRRTWKRSPSTVVSVQEYLLQRPTCTTTRGLACVKSHFDAMFVRKHLHKVPVQHEWQSLRTPFLPAGSSENPPM